MLLLRGKGSGAPFQLLIQLILFGRKKPSEETEPTSKTATMTKLEPFTIPDTIRKTVTESDIQKARNKLRVDNLERDIIGDALTKIYFFFSSRRRHTRLQGDWSSDVCSSD